MQHKTIVITIPFDTTVSKASRIGAIAQVEFGNDWEIVPGQYTGISGDNDGILRGFLTRVIEILDS